MASQIKCEASEAEIIIESQNGTAIPRYLNVSFVSGAGHVYVFNGVTTTNSRWDINFEGKSKLREILYHFNARTEFQEIVRNSKTGSKWNLEERNLCNKEYPFQKGKSFEVKIVVEETKFITYVDGDLYFDYAPAVFDPADIYFLEIGGGVKMNNVTVFERITPQSG